MDHLPLVHDAVAPPDEVEYMTNWEYDGSGLMEYPLRFTYVFKKGRGKYSRENYTLNGEDFSNTSREKTAFIQSWLFFGVLIEVFRVLKMHLDVNDFIREKGGRRYLTMGLLENYITQWQSVEKDSAECERERRGNELDHVLELSVMLVQENLCRYRRYDTVWSLSPQCALSIQLLHEALRHAWGSIYVGTDRLSTPTGPGLLSDLPETRMRAAGWCPSEIAMLQNRLSVTGRFFASRLRRRGKTVSHVDCTDAVCNASQIDSRTYRTQHINANCRCAHLGIDVDEVSSVLKQGKTPRILLSLLKGSEREMDLQIVDYGPYVAISHVWAHGLGNTQANSLPSCQIRRLYEYTRHLPGIARNGHSNSGIPIWIDTLGVPLVRETRKLALKLLPKTYAESTHCLVLDEELLQVSHSSGLEELCLRLVISPWARRLWTFQEGIVTWDKLYLQLRQGAKRFGDFRGQHKVSLCSPLLLESVEEAKSTLPRVEDVRATGGSLVDKLTEACKYRTTSRISDQIFCLASIAGFDVRQIIEATTHEEKMRIFLLQIRDLPTRIIFFKGPKMTLNNFSWAPLSFLHPERTQSVFGFDEDDAPTATCTIKGLQGRWPGFLLKFPHEATPQMDLYYFKYGESWICLNSIDTMQKTLHGATPNNADVSAWQQAHAMGRIGLLVHSLDNLQKMGLLVQIIDDQTETITARSVLTISAMLVPASEIDIFNPSRLDPDRGLLIEGVLISSGTVWNLT